MAKNNVRSFRFSDEVAAVIASQPGKSYNDKFEQLVLTCALRLPQVEEEIKVAKTQLINLYAKCRVAESIFYKLNAAMAQVKGFELTLKAFDDKIIQLYDEVKDL